MHPKAESQIKSRITSGFTWINFSTVLAASLVILTQSVALRADDPSNQPDQPRPVVPVRAPSQLLNLGLMTVVTDLTFLAGQPVRMPNVRVYEVISPRLFTIEPATIRSSRLGHYGYDFSYDNRALVVLGSPATAELRRGVIVEVVGEPWSLFEAQVRHDPAGISELGPNDARRFEHKPVIHADLVRTPGGIELYAAR